MTTGNSDEIAKEIERLIEKVKEEKDEFQRLAGNRLDALEAIGREVGISSYGRTGFEPVRERVAQLVGEHKAAVRLNKEKVEYIQQLEAENIRLREAKRELRNALIASDGAFTEQAVQRAVKRLSREVTFGNGQASDPPELIDHAVKIVLAELNAEPKEPDTGVKCGLCGRQLQPLGECDCERRRLAEPEKDNEKKFLSEDEAALLHALHGKRMERIEARLEALEKDAMDNERAIASLQKVNRAHGEKHMTRLEEIETIASLAHDHEMSLEKHKEWIDEAHRRMDVAGDEIRSLQANVAGHEQAIGKLNEWIEADSRLLDEANKSIKLAESRQTLHGDCTPGLTRVTFEQCWHALLSQHKHYNQLTGDHQQVLGVLVNFVLRAFDQAGTKTYLEREEVEQLRKWQR